MPDDAASDSTTQVLDLANRLLVELVGGLFTVCNIANNLQLVLVERDEAIYLECSRLEMAGPEGLTSVDCMLDPSTASVLLPLLRKARVTAASVTPPADLHLTFDTGHTWVMKCDGDRWDVQGAEVVIEAVPGEPLRVFSGAELGL